MLTILLDDNRDKRCGLLFENPQRVVQAHKVREVPQALAAVSGAQKEGFHAAGFLSFELGLLLEPRLAGLLPAQRDVPLLLFGLYDRVQKLSADEVEAFLQNRALKAAEAGAFRLTQPKPQLTQQAYAQKFEKAQSYIAAGDIYQINLTFKAQFTFSGSAAALFRDLRRKQPVSYGAYIEGDDFSVLSLSPELFVEKTGDEIISRPMKGTAPRGLTLTQDNGLAQALAADEKSRAENLMIVDLMRNDFSRIAKPGSVRVPDLFTVERYGTVLQMTSGISGRLNPAAGFPEIIHALFPPGSVTGAPKLRALEIIRELEDEPRGIYTGAIGHIQPNGDCRFNVAIRTVFTGQDGKSEIGIGSGVVQDSRANNEYEECLLKLKFVTDPLVEFELIETLRFIAGEGYALLGFHMQRLSASAMRLGFNCDVEKIEAALLNYAYGLGTGAHRVRLTLARSGHYQLISQALQPRSGQPFRFVLAETPMDPASLFLYHKTTNRSFYDDERNRLAQITGCDEAVFLNVRGELTEGSFTNLFLEKEGTLLTPALQCGLLPGTLRQDLLNRGKVCEAILTVRDLQKADAIWLGNSVRGLLRAQWLYQGMQAKSGVDSIQGGNRIS